MSFHDLIDHGLTALMPSRALPGQRVGATLTVSDPAYPPPAVYYPPPRPAPQPMEPMEAALVLGGFGLLVGGIFWWSEKRRKERQAGMTPAERSMDDYLQAQANRPAYYGYGYPPPYYGGSSVSFTI